MARTTDGGGLGGGWGVTQPQVAATDLRLMVDHLPDPLLVADPQGICRFANSAGQHILQAAQLALGLSLPFCPDQARTQLKTTSGDLDLRLRWAPIQWEGNSAWLVVLYSGPLEPAQAKTLESSEWEHRAIQAELRGEQLLEQLHRQQEQLQASDDLRHEQQLLLEQRLRDQHQVQEQLNFLQQQLQQSEERARLAEQTALDQWEQSRQQANHLETQLQAALSQLDVRETQRALPQLDQQLDHSQRRFADQLQRIQLLESELDRLRQRSSSREDSNWDHLKNQLRSSQREVQLLQEQVHSLKLRLSQSETEAVQVRQGLEQQLHHLSSEDQEVKRLAFEDQLTRLPNLNILQQFLEYTSALVQREEGAAILLLVDIDRLRSLNSTLGPQAGDELLRQFASRLKSLCRQTDVLGRRGEDEFLLIVAQTITESRELSLARTTVAQLAQTLASKILSACQEPFILEGSPVQASCSIGMAMFGADPLEGALEQVQVALERARELGRARFQFFGPELQDRLRKRQAVVPRLVEALERNEFLLHYQPIIDLRSGKMVGIEALLRWRDPRFGLIEPGEFLQAAESSGLIVQIGEWAVQEACLQAAQFRDLFVSVNLSARQLMHGDFAKRFMKAVERARVKPERIVVEISESTSASDPERISQVLSELARWNVGLAIDDFGTGSSNLLRLQREKPRFLKIDTAFVSQLPDDKTSFHIVLAACHLAANLQMQSLAEGVEREAQLQNLRKMGCNLAQGRLLSPPVNPAELRELTRRTWKLS